MMHALTIALTLTLGQAIDDVWPQGVEKVPGLVEYTSAGHSQYIAVLNEQDYNVWHPRDRHYYFANDSPRINPNAVFPWNSSGGMSHGAIPPGCSNRLAVYLPQQPYLSTHYVQLALAPRPLPRHFWTFADGTVFVDLLLDPQGRCFELRMRKKIAGEWHNFRFAPSRESADGQLASYQVPIHDSRSVSLLGTNTINYRVRHVPVLSRIFERVSLRVATVDDGALVPRGYLGVGLACQACHVHSGSPAYGIGIRGGGDGDFSFSPYERQQR